MEPWHPKQNGRTGIGAIRGADPRLSPPRAAGNVPAAAGASCGAKPVAARLAWLSVCLLAGGESAIGGVEVLADVSVAGPFVQLGDRAIFAAFDQVHGTELWITDGTPAGTRLLQDINPGAASSRPDLAPAATGGLLLFAADDGLHGTELWRTDGSAAGTFLLRDIAPGLESSHPNGFSQFGGWTYFSASTPVLGYELWTANPSLGQASLVADICPGPCSSHPVELTPSGTLYFSAFRPDVGRELFRSDGSAAGTRLVLDIRAGSANSNPSFLTPRGTSSVVFSAFTDDGGTEPWNSGGTADTTYRVEDIYPGPDGSYPLYIANLGGRIYLHACTPDAGCEPYRCVFGSIPRCTRIRDITPGSQSSDPERFVPVAPGSTVALMSAFTPQHGQELWRTDGTEAGTWLVRDTVPGSGSGSPRLLTSVADGVLFLSGALGERELWHSDGTPTGTAPLTAVRGGGYSFSHSILTLGERVLFALQLDSGEPFLPLALHPGLFQDSFEPPPPTPASATEEP